MLNQLLFITLVGRSAVGFQSPPTLKLELLVFNDCPNSPKMLSNVEATLRKLKWKLTIRMVDLTKLPTADRRRGYGAPTLLVNGKDLFGLTRNKSGAVSCRIYPGGVPSISQIGEALKRNK